MGASGWHDLRLCMETMDGLIKTAWRAFWVGLGASAVLIGQSVLSPGVQSAPDHVEPTAAPLVAPAPTAAPVSRCATVDDVTRCS